MKTKHLVDNGSVKFSLNITELGDDETFPFEIVIERFGEVEGTFAFHTDVGLKLARLIIKAVEKQNHFEQ